MCFSFISYFVLSDGPLRGIALFSGEILTAMFANPFEDFKGVSRGPLVVMQHSLIYVDCLYVFKCRTFLPLIDQC